MIRTWTLPRILARGVVGSGKVKRSLIAGAFASACAKAAANASSFPATGRRISFVPRYGRPDAAAWFAPEGRVPMYLPF